MTDGDDYEVEDPVERSIEPPLGPYVEPPSPVRASPVRRSNIGARIALLVAGVFLVPLSMAVCAFGSCFAGFLLVVPLANVGGDLLGYAFIGTVLVGTLAGGILMANALYQRWQEL